MADFTIDRTQPTTFLDNAGNPIDGFLVTVTLTQWNEGHQVQVASLAPNDVGVAIQQLIEDRQALDDLSEA